MKPKDIADWMINEGFRLRKKYSTLFEDMKGEGLYWLVYCIESGMINKKEARKIIEKYYETSLV